VPYPPEGTGDVSPRFQADGGSHAKVSPHFFTHNNAIASFKSQSLGLPAYACKTDSSTAIKLASRMHQNLPFELKNQKHFWGKGHIHFPRPLPGGRDGKYSGRVQFPAKAFLSLTLAILATPTILWPASSEFPDAASFVNNRWFTEFFWPLLPHPFTDRNETRTWSSLSS